MAAPRPPATPDATPGRDSWQLEASGPVAYERFLVPAFFAQCAEAVVAAAGLVPGARILDVACGTGVVARLAAPRVGPHGVVAAVDINAGMIEVGRSVSQDVLPPIQWIVADAAGLPLPDASFDAVCCQQGYQFFRDRGAALRELHRVVAPGGRLVLATWRAIEHNSIFAPFVGALEDHVGTDAADVMRGPFSGPPTDRLRVELAAAGFSSVHASIESVRVRFPSIDEFLRREVLSSPLAGPVGGLDDRAYAAFAADVRSRLGHWVDDAGLAFSMETWIVVATAGSEPEAA